MFKESLFSICPDRTIQPVDSPAGRTFVRSLTVGEKDDFDAAARKTGKLRAHLLVACCCDEAGNPEFTEFDLGRIGALPLYAVEPIVEAALKINKLNEEDSEQIRKNS